MEKPNISELIDKVKSNSQSKTLQKIVPFQTKEKNETQFSFYLSTELLKEVKLRALDEDIKIKTLINKALKLYLKIN
jgi:predicted DNA binding CopG/RHH family protein